MSMLNTNKIKNKQTRVEIIVLRRNRGVRRTSKKGRSKDWKQLIILKSKDKGEKERPSNAEKKELKMSGAKEICVTSNFNFKPVN